MAYYTQANSTFFGLMDKVSASTAALVQAASARFKRYRVFRETYAELAQLNDRDLNDLGISRSMIRGLAREAADNYAGK